MVAVGGSRDDQNFRHGSFRPGRTICAIWPAIKHPNKHTLVHYYRAGQDNQYDLCIVHGFCRLDHLASAPALQPRQLLIARWFA